MVKRSMCGTQSKYLVKSRAGLAPIYVSGQLATKAMPAYRVSIRDLSQRMALAEMIIEKSLGIRSCESKNAF